MEMAQFLIGKILVRDAPEGRTSGRIVETEAYPIGDSSSHAFGGETPARRSMFLEEGRGYVYFTYGAHFCFNVSSEPKGIGAGVLIRALEPLEGIALMQKRRGTTKLLDLARGPGRVAAAMAIDRAVDGIDLCAGRAAVARGRRPADRQHPQEPAHRHQPRGAPPAPLL